MSRPRTFDHDECRALYVTGGFTKSELARRFGVSAARVGQILDPAVNARVNAASRVWARENYRDSCRDCGARIWKRGNAPRTGLCRTCFGASRRTTEHGTEGRYTRHGCRCDDCKAAANAARARRRLSPSVKVHNSAGYSNGCRCDVCRAAHATRCREGYARRRVAA